MNSPYLQVLVSMLLALLKDYSVLGLAVNLREFPLAALYAVAGNGLFDGSVTGCALFAQTQDLHF